MHYYQHHIGDFIKDTAFLQNDEVGIYLKLLWLYYDTEKPLPDNLFELSMKTGTRDNQVALQGILEMFFDKQDGQWQAKHLPPNGPPTKQHQLMNRSSTTVQRPFNQPITNNQ